MNWNITQKEHERKHTKKENTHNFECPFCENLVWNDKDRLRHKERVQKWDTKRVT